MKFLIAVFCFASLLIISPPSLLIPIDDDIITEADQADRVKIYDAAPIVQLIGHNPTMAIAHKAPVPDIQSNYASVNFWTFPNGDTAYGDTITFFNIPPNTCQTLNWHNAKALRMHSTITHINNYR